MLKATQVSFAAAARAAETADAALLNHQFHEQIGQMALNPYLFTGLKRMLIDHTRLSQTFFRPQSEADSARIAKAIDQHDAMIAAIEARDLRSTQRSASSSTDVRLRFGHSIHRWSQR